ncbi:lipase family protein [Nocardia brasiliensis]|uniref:lipase family protein n=1 Tax=Nocardia brasiliensis TaxID=37326 RepID=UPI003D94780E
MRAVTSFEPAQLSGASTPTALWGYSGGTIPSSFAAEYAQDYAPELNIVGVAAGGIAASDMPFLLRHNNRGLFTGLISHVFAGLANEYPDLRQVCQQKLDPLGNFLVNSKYLLCHSIGSAIIPFWDYYGSFGGDPLADPVVQRVIAENSLGQRIPTMPLFMYQAQWDEVLPNAPIDRLADKYCAEGAPSVTYVRELLAEHGIGAVTSIPDAFNWLRDRLDGVPAQSGCHITSTTTQLTEPSFGQALLDIVPPAVQALIGEAIGVTK